MATWRGKPTEPLVSICCTTYNHREFLPYAIESFLNQVTMFPFEILIHDDASTDGTTDYVYSLASRYPTLIKAIVQKENQWSLGRKFHGEYLFPLAQGRYIAICDGDDYWTDSSKLQKQASFLESDSSFVLCYTDSLGLDERSGENVDLRAARRDLSKLELQGAASMFTSSVCFRNTVEHWPEQLTRAPYGDMVMWSLLGDYGKGKYLEELTPIRQRIHPEGVHSQKSRTHQFYNALNTHLLIASHRIQGRDFQLALPHLQSIFVLSVKLYRAAFFTSLISRIRRKLTGS